MTSPFPVPVRTILLPRANQRQSRGVGALSSETNAIAQGVIGTVAAIPGVGQIAAAIGEIGLQLANIFSGCGQTCVASTEIANQVGDLLTQNLQTYLAAPVHYASLQQAALQNFDNAWAQLEQACGNAALGQAGQNCITARQNGACVYKTSPGGWTQVNGTWQYNYPGANGSGDTCWNYFVGFYDPIANDPTVVADPGSVLSSVPAFSSLLSDLGISSSATIFGLPVSDVILAGLALIALVFIGGHL